MSTGSYPLSTIAKLLNLTERRVQQLAKEGIVVRDGKGKYDLVGSVRGYIKYLQDRSLGKDLAPIDSHIEKARLLRAQADKTEMEVKALQKSLLPVTQIKMSWMMMLSSFRTRMLSIPAKTAHLLAPIDDNAEIERILREQIYEGLTELSDYDPEKFIGADQGMPQGTGTAAETDGVGVGGSVQETKPGSERGAGKV